ncbi:MULTISPECIES: hypothetical protein [unclassified Sphingomonas]|uniref:hypothetical protein n=1 Tax=unclassified Sphingomonas TaxID=196159 RepID=UPI002269D61D|nr:MULTISPECIES: hypothetical protein [unclassified Sphingomonas]
MTVDRGWLGELLELTASAVAAVERGNNRAAGVKLERRCTSALISTGSAPEDCPH